MKILVGSEEDSQTVLSLSPLVGSSAVNNTVYLQYGVIEYLFSLNGFNKSKLAKNLDLSYSVVVERTKFLTST